VCPIAGPARKRVGEHGHCLSAAARWVYWHTFTVPPLILRFHDTSCHRSPRIPSPRPSGVYWTIPELAREFGWPEGTASSFRACLIWSPVIIASSAPSALPARTSVRNEGRWY
jgi:hypothetical protein